jgi:hypothetical protein
MSGFGVYVIQLRTCGDKTALGALYVGSSVHPPSERFRQHDEGDHTGALGLTGECRRLRPELYLDLQWQWDRRRIVAMERYRARRLAEAGFQVRSDGWRHDAPRAGSRRPFGLEELEAVREVFEGLARELAASAVRPLSPEELVRALRWTSRDPGVADFVATPNDVLGRFSHADEHAVRVLAERVFRAHPTLVVQRRSSDPPETALEPTERVSGRGTGHPPRRTIGM